MPPELAQDVALLRDVWAGECIGWAGVAIDATDPTVRFRREMEAAFPAIEAGAAAEGGGAAMMTTFPMPTRIVAGAGSLGGIGALAADLGMSRVLVVSDPVISMQSFHAAAVASLAEAKIAFSRFDECGIGARCSHIDDQGERVRRDGIDGVICIGDGSVTCTVKGVAIERRGLSHLRQKPQTRSSLRRRSCVVSDPFADQAYAVASGK